MIPKKKYIKKLSLWIILFVIGIILTIVGYFFISYMGPIAKWEWNREPCHYFSEIESSFNEAKLIVSNEECKIIDGQKKLFFLLEIKNTGTAPLKFKKEELRISENPVSWDSRLSIVPNHIYEIQENNKFNFYIPIKNETISLKITNPGLV